VPEGDSLYRFAGRLRRVLEGQVVAAARSHGPGPVPQVHRLIGSTCTGVRSVGKNVIISFDNGLALRGHLRMYGTWHIYGPGEPWSKPESAARLVLEVPSAVVVNFNAPVIELLEERAIEHHVPIASLGPDLLDDNFDHEEAFRRFRSSRLADLTIGDAIMDQWVMAGVGNIWKHETLFHCRVNPWRQVKDLEDDLLHQLIVSAQELLRASAGKTVGGRWNGRRPTMFVYARAGQPCRRCHSRIRTARQGIDIRYTAWCPRCQPEVLGQTPPPVRRGARSS
jgi:endonuclease VIII